jgi:hypothetical protein
MTSITSTRAAARQLGLSDTALHKAERAGRITREADGSWDLEGIRRSLASTLTRKKSTKAAAWRDRVGAGDDVVRPVSAGSIASTRELGRQLGISHTALMKAERAGRIAREPNGRWDLEKVRSGLTIRPDPADRAPYGSRGPWAKPAQYFSKLDTDIIGPVRNIHTELEAARRALQRAAEQISALYPEILRLERACDAAIAAQERGGE